jgi:hypothetical protein
MSTDLKCIYYIHFRTSNKGYELFIKSLRIP